MDKIDRFYTVLVAILILSMVSLSSCKTKQMAFSSNADEYVEEEESFVDSVTGEINYYNSMTWVLGYFTRDRLETYPHDSWMTEGYYDYAPQSVFLNSLLDLRWDNVTVTLVMGTWCPDSRREVPRFLRIMDILDFPADKITYIGVDLDKQSPVGGYEELDIQRVPTFIFYVNNSEVGRIIEVPTSSLEEDMVNILFQNK